MIELSGVEITRVDCINTVLKYLFWLDVYHKRLEPYHEKTYLHRFVVR